MDDFFNRRNDRFYRNDPFFDDGLFPPYNRSMFDSPFSALHNSMQQIHREMDEMMRSAFGNFPRSQYPHQYPAIDQSNRDQDLDKQVQQYGLNSVFNDNDYLSDWDFVKQLEQLEKQPKTLQNPSNPNMRYYGRSHFYNYSSTGDGKVEERKIIQDSKGNRMESIQKKLGDRIWAKTLKQNEKGEVDEDEKMINMDEKDKERFLNDWRSNVNTFLDRGIDTSVKLINPSIEANPEQTTNKEELTLPSLSQKKENNWFNKIKFW